MNFKRMITSAVVGASMLGLVGTATAATVDLDIYGASAQYLYWNAVAPNVLTNQGCTNVQQATKNSTNAITRATCGADTVYYRVSSKASFDGILALKGDDTYAAAGPAAEKCSAGDPGDPGLALRPFYRKMVDETSCTWGTPAAPGTCTALKCVPVTLGASDVGGDAFTQSSSGQLKGPLGGGPVTRSFTGINTAGLTAYNPIVVPFAFFANTSVQRDLAYPVGGGAHVANWQTITNLPRMMAVMIFSGQAFNWTDFGADFTSAPVVACLRHAGSGTHATLDHAVMNRTWGGGLPVNESLAGPTVWFNDGSSDETKCVAGSGLWSGTGAIGYADADQATSATMVRLQYNGEDASRINIRNGRYDFWTKEWMYENPAAPAYAQTHPYVSAMMTYAANPASIPGAVATVWGGTDKTLWWATNAEMNYMKTGDKSYPAYVGATSPQLP